MTVFNAAECGVLPDAEKVQTAALQKLIDRCAATGGGRIELPRGVYITGTLELCDDLELVLDAGAVLAGSADEADYPLYDPAPVPFFEGRYGIRALLFAYGKKNLKLTGPGLLDGRNELYRGNANYKTWPRAIWFGRCENVAVSGLAMRNANFWFQHYIQCRGVRLAGLDIYNHNCRNNDGIDIDSCDGVLIEDCRIDSSDDAICLKCGTPEPCRNVTVRNCETRTHFGHFKLGTESNGGFEHIRCSGLRMVPSRRPDDIFGDYRGITGLALSAVDGAFLSDVEIDGVTMTGVRMPLLLRFGDRRRGVLGEERGGRPPAFYRGVRIRNIHATGASAFGCYISGLQAHPMRDIHVADCRLEFEGAFDPAWQTRVPPEAEEITPCTTAFGDDGLPAYLWTRYAEVEFRNVEIVRVPGDLRPEITVADAEFAT